MRRTRQGLFSFCTRTGELIRFTDVRGDRVAEARHQTAFGRSGADAIIDRMVQEKTWRAGSVPVSLSTLIQRQRRFMRGSQMFLPKPNFYSGCMERLAGLGEVCSRPLEDKIEYVQTEQACVYDKQRSENHHIDTRTKREINRADHQRWVGSGKQVNEHKEQPSHS
jgi:hypothetical protein